MDDAVLTAARANIASLLPETCDIWRAGVRVNDRGLTVSGPELLHHAVRCRLSLSSGTKLITTIAGGQVSVQAEVALEWGTDVQPTDTITVGDTTWMVQSVVTGPLSASLTAYVTRVPR